MTVAVAIASVAVVAWLAVDILLLIFGGILLAILLRALSDPIAARTPLSRRVSLTVVLLALVGLGALGIWYVAPELVAQVEQLWQALPHAVEQVRSFLDRYGLGGELPGDNEDDDQNGNFLALAAGMVPGAVQTTAYVLTLLFVGLFVAYNPGLYRRGTLLLVPSDHRDQARELIDTLGYTIRWWLIGRALAMIMVGVSTWIAMLIMGLPLAGLVGFTVGILTFIPYLGPVLGTIPVAIVGLMEGPTDALYAIVVYTVIQHIEGYVIDPLIQQKMVYLPPAITVAVQIGMALLLGTLGIALATPLAAVVMVTIQKTYLERPGH